MSKQIVWVPQGTEIQVHGVTVKLADHAIVLGEEEDFTIDSSQVCVRSPWPIIVGPKKEAA